ncbi:hypothetical protein D3C76_654910 [compost metagenome]
MGALTRMTWPQTTLLEVLEDAEKTANTFDIVCLELNDGRTFTVAVVCGEHAEAAHQMLDALKHPEGL